MTERERQLSEALREAATTLRMIKDAINDEQNKRIMGERANWRSACDFAYNEIDGRADDLLALADEQ